MTVLSRLILKAMFWGGVGVGVFTGGLAMMLAYALTNPESGISAGQNPGVGLGFLAGLSVLCFITAFIVRRELNKQRGVNV